MKRGLKIIIKTETRTEERAGPLRVDYHTSTSVSSTVAAALYRRLQKYDETSGSQGYRAFLKSKVEPFHWP
jgi:hypothetical protein